MNKSLKPKLPKKEESRSTSESIRVTVSEPRAPSRQLTSPFILIYGFALLIGVGTVLLMLPISNNTTTISPFITALFTAISAVTVTGLTVVNTASYWSFFGQAVILLLIFLGGLGFITLATFLLVIVGRKLSLGGRLTLSQTVGQSSIGQVVRLTKIIVMVSVLIQILGTINLYFPLSKQFEMPESLWQAGFHSISAFNNAGFSILPNSYSLSLFSGNAWLLGTMALLIIVGGLSFPVLADLLKRRKFKRFSLDTQLVLVSSILLWVLGALGFFALEFNNSQTIGDFNFLHQLIDSIFQSISGRTAGFTTVDFSDTGSGTNFFYIALMFIGGASASTAAGIKVNTAALIMVAVIAAVKGRSYPVAFGKEVSAPQVYRALAIAALAVTSIFVIGFAITLISQNENPEIPFLHLIFETVSAFSANGTTTGITAEVTDMTKLLLGATMFLGRLGPLTFALALAQREQKPNYRFAVDEVRIA